MLPSDLCYQFGPGSTLFNRWRKALFPGDAAAFKKQQNNEKEGLGKRISSLEQKLNKRASSSPS
jgi:hypothetical protein